MLSESNLDFLGLSETWLNKNSSIAAMNFPGYNVFRRDRTGGEMGGGVLIYVKDTIKCSPIEWSHEMEVGVLG